MDRKDLACWRRTRMAMTTKIESERDRKDVARWRRTCMVNGNRIDTSSSRQDELNALYQIWTNMLQCKN